MIQFLLQLMLIVLEFQLNLKKIRFKIIMEVVDKNW